MGNSLSVPPLVVHLYVFLRISVVFQAAFRGGGGGLSPVSQHVH